MEKSDLSHHILSRYNEELERVRTSVLQMGGFVEEQLKTDSDIVMLSAMMTTSMVGIKKLIPMIKEKNPKVKIMIGGAPITEKTVEEYGADVTADNAPNALREAMKMLETLRKG